MLGWRSDVQRVSGKVTVMISTTARVARFLRDPFDPVNNSLLFDALIARHIDHDIVAESIDAAVECIKEHSRQHPDFQFPDVDSLRALWDEISPATKYLIMTHDVEHALRGIPQSISGEYDLAFSLMCDPRHKIDRLYGFIACSTAPYGALRSRSLAPYFGILKSSKRCAMNIFNRMCAEQAGSDYAGRRRCN